MAKRKKIGAGEILIFGLAAFVALIMMVPREVWIFMGVVGAVGFLFFLSGREKKPLPAPLPVKSTAEPASKQSGGSIVCTFIPSKVPLAARVTSPVVNAVEEDFFAIPVVSKEKHSEKSEYQLPPPPETLGPERWIPAGESVEIAGMLIPGGLLYVGRPKLKSGLVADPSLIATNEPVASRGDYTERQFSYWPSYSTISSEARRVIIDSPENISARQEWPLIMNELQRLIVIYGDLSGSFRNYAGKLVDWMSLGNCSRTLYREQLPDFTKSYELPVYIKLALGQAAVDGVAVPVDLALAWVRNDPAMSLRTPAARCKDEFDRLFAQYYRDKFKEGMLLPCNKTKLKCFYQPASSGVPINRDLKGVFGDIPDVTILTAPIKKLQAIVEIVTKELEPYSRYVGRQSEARYALEGLLLLPFTLWPESAKSKLQDLKLRISNEMVVMSFLELLSLLDAASVFSRDKAVALANALEAAGIGIEPDLLSGARSPKPEDMLVLFGASADELSSRTTASYQSAVLTLQVASAVAAADGDFSASEIAHLSEQIQTWTHLTPCQIQRLLAHLRLLVVAPASLPALKKKLEPLDLATKDYLAVFMASVVQSDGKVDVEEVKILEKVYKILGVDPKRVFSDLHTNNAGNTSDVSISKGVEAGFNLDPARIAALQQDSAKVSALLANIFNEEEADGQTDNQTHDDPAAVSSEETSELVVSMSLLGLDEAHSGFVRRLLVRPQWGRQELLDVADDLDLMLDGALEHINEAAYDIYDLPFTEGEDPIEINPEVVEKIEI